MLRIIDCDFSHDISIDHEALIIILIIVSTIVINSMDIKLKALIIMWYCKNYSSIREGLQAAMLIKTLLQALASSSNGDDNILSIQCCHRFNLHSLVVTQEVIWRLYGYDMKV